METVDRRNDRERRGWAVLAVCLVTCFLLSVSWQGRALAIPRADLVVVNKSERRLSLVRAGRVFRRFPISLGAHPRGHKREQGDERTPEGRYILDRKNSHSHFYKSIHISYPNGRDRKQARKRGVDPGGDIMIHGQKNGWQWLSPLSRFIDWTDGCIAVSNHDMDAIWQAVRVGTPIEIRP